MPRSPDKSRAVFYVSTKVFAGTLSLPQLAHKYRLKYSVVTFSEPADARLYYVVNCGDLSTVSQIVLEESGQLFLERF